MGAERSSSPESAASSTSRIAELEFPTGVSFTPDQFQRNTGGEIAEGTVPARGVIEIKPTGEDAWVVADGPQVTRYWGKYRQVLVTNYRDFVLVGQDIEGKPTKLETYRLAANEVQFWKAASSAKKTAEKLGASFEEFLKRVLLNTATLASPEDVAGFSLPMRAKLNSAPMKDICRLSPRSARRWKKPLG